MQTVSNLYHPFFIWYDSDKKYLVFSYSRKKAKNMLLNHLWKNGDTTVSYYDLKIQKMHYDPKYLYRAYPQTFTGEPHVASEYFTCEECYVRPATHDTDLCDRCFDYEVKATT